MNSAPPKLESAIRERLAPSLRQDGFSGSGRTFRRITGDWLQVVNIQGSRYGGSFAINLGLHPLAIPDVLGNKADPRKITEALCEFRRRLSETDERSDKWWEHDGIAVGMSDAMDAAAKTFVQFGRPLLNRVASATADLNTIHATDFAARSFDFGGFGSTKVRMALALARLRASRGDLQEAREFVAYGLSALGDSSPSLKTQFLAVAPLA